MSTSPTNLTQIDIIGLGGRLSNQPVILKWDAPLNSPKIYYYQIIFNGVNHNYITYTSSPITTCVYTFNMSDYYNCTVIGVCSGSFTTPSQSIQINISIKPDAPIILGNLLSGSCISLSWTIPLNLYGSRIVYYNISETNLTSNNTTIIQHVIGQNNTSTQVQASTRGTYSYQVQAIIGGMIYSQISAPSYPTTIFKILPPPFITSDQIVNMSYNDLLVYFGGFNKQQISYITNNTINISYASLSTFTSYDVKNYFGQNSPNCLTKDIIAAIFNNCPLQILPTILMIFLNFSKSDQIYICSSMNGLADIYNNSSFFNGEYLNAICLVLNPLQINQLQPISVELLSTANFQQIYYSGFFSLSQKNQFRKISIRAMGNDIWMPLSIPIIRMNGNNIYMTQMGMPTLTYQQYTYLSIMQISTCPNYIIQTLSNELIQLFFQYLTLNQVMSLTQDQCNSLTPAQIAALTTAQIAVLTTTQIAVLTTTQIQALTTTQIAVLTTTQIRALTPAQYNALTPAQIAALTPL